MRFRLFSSGVILVFVLAASACGGSKHKAGAPSASSPGAKVFATAGCAGCHTLKAADAKGQVGPNLDELKPDQPTVVRQVRNGGNGMPSFKDRLSGNQISQVALFVADATHSAASTFPTFKPDKTTVAECQQSSKPFCYRQAFGNIAYNQGPQKALALLATDDRTISGVHADCHQITHWVGHAGLLYYKNDAGTALSHGAMTCNSGYYHGVLQLALAGLPKDKVVKKSQHLCDAPPSIRTTSCSTSASTASDTA